MSAMMKRTLFFTSLTLVGLALTIAACDQFTTTEPPKNTPIPTPIPNTPPVVAFPTSAAITVVPPTVPIDNASPSTRPLSIAPIVQIASPVTNTQVSISQTMFVGVYAADDSGIARIELYDDGALVKAENAPAPAPTNFSAMIPWTPAYIGFHSLRAIAINTANRTSTPDEVIIPVTTDVRKPSSVILYPVGTPQAEVGSVVQIQAAAIDDVGVTQLELWVDNQLYTYIASQNASGQIPLTATFTWIPTTVGSHTLMLRTYDNQAQTSDSAQVKITIVDTHAPSINVTWERTNAQANEPITVTITALDAVGIQRIELWSGKDNINTMTSANPARQTSMTVQMNWQSANVGDFPLIVRAYNSDGNVKESAPQIINILRPAQSTPIPTTAPTPTRTRTPRPTATPRLQPPPPPVAELIAPLDHFVGAAPFRVTYGGKGSAELDRVELWGYMPGQPGAQLLCQSDAKATTQKNVQCDITPPYAGMISMYAQVYDSYRQVGRSQTISGYVGLPILPTPTATPFLLSGRWVAPTFAASFQQTSTVLRGTVRTAPTGTTEIEGRITSGTIKSDRVTFRVEFLPATTSSTPVNLGTETPAPSPTPIAPAIDFDCGVEPGATTLTCTWKDARGRTGNTMFKKE